MSVLKSNFYAKRCSIHLRSPYTTLGAVYGIADVTGSAGPFPIGGRGLHNPCVQVPPSTPALWATQSFWSVGFILKPKEGWFLEQSRSAGRGVVSEALPEDQPWDWAPGHLTLQVCPEMTRAISEAWRVLPALALARTCDGPLPPGMIALWNIHVILGFFEVKKGDFLGGRDLRPEF